MAPAGLASMPIELLVHIIATYLSTKDIGALRLTNKYFERALFDSFAKEFFTKKQFMLTTPSLRALVDISQHTALSQFVKHVIIGLEQYGNRSLSLDPANQVRFDNYRDGWADQIDLTTNGRDREMLAEAFRNLPNLETLGIRDYSAQGRAREGDARWHSYGAPTVREHTGLRLSCNLVSGSLDFASKVYGLLLYALGDANKVVPSIEVILRRDRAGLSDFAFRPSPSTVPKLGPVLASLQTLLLTLNLLASNNSPTYLPFPANNLPFGQNFYLAEFLTHTKNLKHLRLNFQHHELEATIGLLRQLSQPSSNALLPRLESLDFGIMTVTPEVLLQVLAKFAPTLHTIGFWKVRLSYTAQQNVDMKPNPWRNFLMHVLKVDSLNFSSMMLGCIEQADNSGSSVRVLFSDRMEEEIPSDGKEDRMEVSRHCKGDMKTFLPRLIGQLRVQWPEPPLMIQDEDDSNSISDEDPDEDDMEDEEEHDIDGEE